MSVGFGPFAGRIERPVSGAAEEYVTVLTKFDRARAKQGV